MGANRWPTEYIYPRELAAAAPLEVIRYHAFVLLVGAGVVFVVHIEEFGVAVRDDADPHQTTVCQWLKDTAAPRTAPIPGFRVELGPGSLCRWVPSRISGSPSAGSRSSSP